jgi:hypothetical protein
MTCLCFMTFSMLLNMSVNNREVLHLDALFPHHRPMNVNVVLVQSKPSSLLKLTVRLNEQRFLTTLGLTIVILTSVGC